MTPDYTKMVEEQLEYERSLAPYIDTRAEWTKDRAARLRLEDEKMRCDAKLTVLVDEQKKLVDDAKRLDEDMTRAIPILKKAEREKALREAAEIADGIAISAFHDKTESTMEATKQFYHNQQMVAEQIHQRILALITKEKV